MAGSSSHPMQFPGSPVPKNVPPQTSAMPGMNIGEYAPMLAQLLQSGGIPSFAQAPGVPQQGANAGIMPGMPAMPMGAPPGAPMGATPPMPQQRPEPPQQPPQQPQQPPQQPPQGADPNGWNTQVNPADQGGPLKKLLEGTMFQRLLQAAKQRAGEDQQAQPAPRGFNPFEGRPGF